jgi:hypothetical protein
MVYNVSDTLRSSSKDEFKSFLTFGEFAIFHPDPAFQKFAIFYLTAIVAKPGLIVPLIICLTLVITVYYK